MMLAVLALLAVAIVLAWWVKQQAIRYRREAESREALVLEAVFASRHTADGGASIDVDRIFGAGPALAPLSADVMPHAVVEPAQINESPSPAPAPVRDLVQALYEARGFRPAPARPSARPIEVVLTHKSDAQRAYALAPLAQPPSEAGLQSILERARGIGQKRVLIAVEAAMAADPDGDQPGHGVRVLGRAAIEAQLGRLDAGVADRIRRTAGQRASQRSGAG